VLGGGASGNSAGSRIGEVLAASWLKAAWVGEVGALSALAGFGTPFGLGGFKGSDVDFSAWVLGALSTFWDSPIAIVLFVAESRMIS
jgi:hypothetical protein